MLQQSSNMCLLEHSNEGSRVLQNDRTGIICQGTMQTNSFTAVMRLKGALWKWHHTEAARLLFRKKEASVYN